MPLQETIGEFEYELEKGERLKKNKLIDIFYEVEQRFNEGNAEVIVETTTEEYEEYVGMLKKKKEIKQIIKTLLCFYTYKFDSSSQCFKIVSIFFSILLLSLYS